MNSEIGRLKELIAGYEDEVSKINRLKLGFLLSYARYGSLRGLISREKEYIVGKFGFTVNCHDTGNTVRVDLIASDGDRLNIINGTYWHNESQYGFNSFHRLNGAWDDAFKVAIDKIRRSEILLLDKELEQWIKKLNSLKTEYHNVKSKFESEFI